MLIGIPAAADRQTARPRHRADDHRRRYRRDVPGGRPDAPVHRRRARESRSQGPSRSICVLHDYQRNRILIFLDPESDPLGTGYHISQSKIAIGSGGLWGKGFLNGTQSHLDYLPEGHTDFVFATMAEEWGLVGGCLLILAFLLVIRWGVNVGQQAQHALRSPDRRGPRHDDLLLRRDQPGDGDGPRAGRRHSAAPGQLRRFEPDDRAVLHGHSDVDRPRKSPPRSLVGEKIHRKCKKGFARSERAC
jgi:hypothetical protein